MKIISLLFLLATICHCEQYKGTGEPENLDVIPTLAVSRQPKSPVSLKNPQKHTYGCPSETSGGNSNLCTPNIIPPQTPWDEQALTIRIEDLVSPNSQNLDIRIDGKDIESYAYVLLDPSTIRCSEAEFSQWLDVSIRLTDNLGEDGAKLLCIKVRDATGKWLTLEHSWIKDMISPDPPDVSGVSPQSNSKPTWAFSSSSGGGGNGTYRYKMDNSDLNSGAAETSASSYTPEVPLPDGDHTLYVQERDDAGNWSASGQKLIHIDTSAPMPLTVFSGASGPVIGEIDLTFDFPGGSPDYTEDYDRIEIRRLSGGTAPSDCVSGDLVMSITIFNPDRTIADATGSPGSPFSYRACIYDTLNNLTSTQTVENVLAQNITEGLAELVSATSTGDAATLSLNTQTMTGAEGSFYLAVIAANPAGTLTSVSGLGLTWLPLRQELQGTESSVEVWFAVGDGSTTDGAIAADIEKDSGNLKSAVLTVARYLDIDVDSPMGRIDSNNGNSSSFAKNFETSENDSYLFAAINTTDVTVDSYPGTFQIQNSNSAGSGADQVRLSLFDGAFSAPGSENFDGNLSATGSWSLIGLELKRSGTKPAFQEVFATTTVYSGNMGGILNADKECQNLAIAESFSGYWKALLPSADVAVRDRAFVFGPIRNINGDTVASSYSTFWSNSHSAALNFTQTGGTPPEDRTWTGFHGNGATNTNGICNGWTSTGSVSNRGDNRDTDQEWAVFNNDLNRACNNVYPIFCISQ